MAAALPADRTRKDIAQDIGMTPDAFSRALKGHRGFAALELARLADLLHVDIHFLITGEPNPRDVLIAARHSYDHVTGRRSVAGEETDRQDLQDVVQLYRQAEPVHLPTTQLPADVAKTRERLGPDFVQPFATRLEAMNIDVVRLTELSTAYSFTVNDRAVIVLGTSGQWFRDNWSLAHELGHLVLRHGDLSQSEDLRRTAEVQANAFAAELLLPEAEIRGLDWKSVSAPELAERLWVFGVSTEALANRLSRLELQLSPATQSLLGTRTPSLLRRHWRGFGDGTPMTQRMTDASQRRFPTLLKDAHLDLISQGLVVKAGLAWMLDVDAETLEVDEPPRSPALGSAELSELLGI